MILLERRRRKSMFREMRRKRQQLEEAEAIRILREGSHGTLALSGDDGYPYALPISYAYADGILIFHSALTGHKIDSIRRSEKASFTVIEQDEVVPEEYTTLYRSVIAFGRIRIVDDNDEKIRLLRILSAKYAPMNSDELRDRAIEIDLHNTALLVLDIEHMTGKESKDLAARRRKER